MNFKGDTFDEGKLGHIVARSRSICCK